MHVAAIQMVSTPDVEENLQTAHTLIEQAAQAGAELVALPEYFFMMGHADADKLHWRESFGSGKVQSFLAQAARAHSVYLIGGSIALTADSPAHARNSTLVFDPSGECIARYDKIHLFQYHKGRESYNEAKTLEPGSTTIHFMLPSKDGHVWRIGLAICYDLRFPEMFRQLAADLIVVPAAFTYSTGQAHWEVLLRARAIENLAYVLASAQGGLHQNQRQTWGHSMLVDTWGNVQNTLPYGQGVVHGSVDIGVLTERRTALPALMHRRM